MDYADEIILFGEKMDKLKQLFLEQTYKDAQEYWEGSKEGKYDSWDFVIITASNEFQAKNFRRQIEDRKKYGIIDLKPEYIVIPDVDGKRIGSGGATLNVLALLWQKYSIDWEKHKILLVHSGGDSRRIPQFSVSGKLFCPVPRSVGNIGLTLFDELLASVALIPSRMTNGMLLMSGDVLTIFNPLQVDLKEGGICAISAKTDVETAINHGVYSLDEDNFLREYLHKKTHAEVSEIAHNGSVNIDTGIVFLDGKNVKKLAELGMEEKNDSFCDMQTNFYADFLYPLAEKSTCEEYLRQPAEGGGAVPTDKLAAIRKRIWRCLKGVKMKVITPHPSVFIHFGTTESYLKLMNSVSEDFPYLNWNSNTVSDVTENIDYSIYQSTVYRSTVGSGSHIENSRIQNSQIGEGCVISNCLLNGVEIPSGLVLSCLKLNTNEYVTRIFGVSDNPKQNYLFSKNITSKFDKAKSKENLWDLNVYRAASTPEKSVEYALSLYHAVIGNDWRYFSDFDFSNAYSLKSSFNSADAEWLLQWRNDILKDIQIEKIRSILDNSSYEFENGSYSELSILGFKKYEDEISTRLTTVGGQIRYNYFRSLFSQTANEALKYENLAFGKIGDLLNVGNNFRIGKLRHDKVVTKLPVRVNFGGGWSDTPPFCYECGGTVLNASVLLEGEYPITAEVCRTDQKLIVLESADSGLPPEVFRSRDELLNCSDPFDNVALQKAALVATGIVTKNCDADLSDVFDNLGGGLILRTNVENVPRGSGLGTSSILAYACVKSLYDAMDIAADVSETIEKVSQMEQLMSTGGGWQDQVGGGIIGVKLIKSNKGDQKLDIQNLSLTHSTRSELDQRFALVYTGQRRLARNLLRSIMGKYISGDKATRDYLEEIQYLALLEARELEKGNVEAFASLLNKHWEIQKLLDKGSTNTCIEYIFNSIDDLVSGKMICGAGGGGFLQLILKERVTIEDLSKRISENFHDSGVKVWKSNILFE